MRNDEKIATKQEERCNNKQPRLSTGSETSIKTKHHQKWGTEKSLQKKNHKTDTSERVRKPPGDGPQCIKL